MRHVGNVQVSGSLKQQGSDDNQFMGDLNIANVIILSKTGSTVFGDDATDTHTFNGDVTITGFLTADDGAISRQALKENIQDVDINHDSGDVLDSIEIVSYNLKSNGRYDIGVIVEQVYEVFPEMVRLKDGEPFAFDTGMLYALAVREIQKLRQRVAQLESGSI